MKKKGDTTSYNFLKKWKKDNLKDKSHNQFTKIEEEEKKLPKQSTKDNILVLQNLDYYEHLYSRMISKYVKNDGTITANNNRYTMRILNQIKQIRPKLFDKIYAKRLITKDDMEILQTLYAKIMTDHPSNYANMLSSFQSTFFKIAITEKDLIRKQWLYYFYSILLHIYNNLGVRQKHEEHVQETKTDLDLDDISTKIKAIPKTDVIAQLYLILPKRIQEFMHITPYTSNMTKRLRNPYIYMRENDTFQYVSSASSNKAKIDVDHDFTIDNNDVIQWLHDNENKRFDELFSLRFLQRKFQKYGLTSDLIRKWYANTHKLIESSQMLEHDNKTDVINYKK